jgi:hypothetical protein
VLQPAPDWSSRAHLNSKDTKKAPPPAEVLTYFRSKITVIYTTILAKHEGKQLCQQCGMVCAQSKPTDRKPISIVIVSQHGGHCCGVSIPSSSTQLLNRVNCSVARFPRSHWHFLLPLSLTQLLGHISGHFLNSFVFDSIVRSTPLLRLDCSIVHFLVASTQLLGRLDFHRFDSIAPWCRLLDRLIVPPSRFLGRISRFPRFPVGHSDRHSFRQTFIQTDIHQTSDIIQDSRLVHDAICISPHVLGANQCFPQRHAMLASGIQRNVCLRCTATIPCLSLSTMLCLCPRNTQYYNLIP